MLHVFWSLMSAALGASVAAFVFWLRVHEKLGYNKQLVQTYRDDTEKQIRDHQHQGALTALQRAQERRNAMRQSIEKQRRDLTELDAAMDEHEQIQEERRADLDTLQTDVDEQGRNFDAAKAALKHLRHSTREKALEIQEILHKRSELDEQDAINSLVEESRGDLELSLQRRARTVEAASEEHAYTECRRLMGLAMERYNGVGHQDRIQNTLPLDNKRTFEALADPSTAAHQAFVSATGAELHVSDTPLSLSVRGDDPLAREIARRVLRAVKERSVTTEHAVAAVVGKTKQTIDREIKSAATKAFRVLELKEAHPEIMHLVGRLKFRLSYSQNQWKHAIEVAFISNMLAEELGLDPVLARRGGLLHDIGKALTHEQEGSHAVIGADVARRCGENEVVANAIGSHHNDEPMNTPVAYIVTAADAISGARPGARREALTQYMDRVNEIRDIASASPAVVRVDVMQAGREVRVVVAGRQRGDVPADERTGGGKLLADRELHPLAADIAREIEEQITFPGQIRVTVIRETRCVSIAH